MSKCSPIRRTAAAWTTLAASILLAAGCGPPEITRERAVRWITEQHLPRPVESFSYRLDIAARYRLLESCAAAGLIALEGRGLDMNVRITPEGRKYFSRLAKTRVDRTLQYTLFFAEPVQSEVLSITAIRDFDESYKQVGYTWKYLCPPMLEHCTTMNSEPQVGSAKFIRWKDHWKIK